MEARVVFFHLCNDAPKVTHTPKPTKLSLNDGAIFIYEYLGQRR